MTPAADTDFRPLYERIVTPGHVLAARLRVALPALTRTTVVVFALSTAAFTYMLSAGGEFTPAPAPTSKRAELLSQVSGKFNFGQIQIPADKLTEIVDAAEAKDALEFINNALAGGKLAFDATMMTKLSGVEFASGAWTPGKIAVADAGDVVAFGMFVKGPYNAVMRWTVVARKFSSEFKLAELVGYPGAFLTDRSRAIGIASHPDTFNRILAASK